MGDDNNNLRFRSYWWLIILLILAFLICIFVKSSNKSTDESANKYQKETELVEMTSVVNDGNFSKKKLKDKSKVNSSFKFYPNEYSEIIQQNNFYDKLSPGINSAIEQLQRKSHEAKRIIRYFPDFPGIWLLPPKDKGIYSSIPERYCIEFLHLLFPGHTFIKEKHKWLRNPKTNYPLELDGYCPELMIAIEYNGIQHYVWPNYFHTTIKDFFDQRNRDQIKAEICIKEHICLIRIPYTVPLERIPLAIYAKLLEAVPSLNF
jgi:hypothetical protein